MTQFFPEKRKLLVVSRWVMLYNNKVTDLSAIRYPIYSFTEVNYNVQCSD